MVEDGAILRLPNVSQRSARVADQESPVIVQLVGHGNLETGWIRPESRLRSGAALRPRLRGTRCGLAPVFGPLLSQRAERSPLGTSSGPKF